jgi:hypothetical protein
MTEQRAVGMSRGDRPQVFRGPLADVAGSPANTTMFTLLRHGPPYLVAA